MARRRQTRTSIIDRTMAAIGRGAGSLVAGYREKTTPKRRPRFFSSWAQQGRYGSYENTYTSDLAQRRALGNSWYYAGVQYIQREFVSAGFEVQAQRDVDTEAVSVPNHPLEKLLVRPNPIMGTSYFWQYTLWWLYLRGEAHWFVLCDIDRSLGKSQHEWQWRRCPYCGTRIKDYLKHEHCPYCSGPLHENVKTRPMLRARYKNVVDHLLTCKYCGTAFDELHELCPACSAPFLPEAGPSKSLVPFDYASRAGPYYQRRYAEPIELWPLPSQYVEPVPGDDERFIDHYEYTANGAQYTIPAEYVIHFRFPNPYDIFRGLSPLSSGMLPVDTDVYQSMWNMNFFGNDRAMPDSIINLATSDGQPVDEDTADMLIADLRSDYQVHRRHTAITSVYKLEVQKLVESHQDMEFNQGREFNRNEILNVLGLHPAIFDPNATEANAKVGERVGKATVHAVHVLVGQEITAQLLWPYYGQHYKAHFDDIRQTDRALMFQEQDRARGALTVQEYRRRYYDADALGDERDDHLYGETAAAAAPETPMWEFTPEMEAAAMADLDRWKDKAIRSFKRKRVANVPFESEFVSATVLGHIALRLSKAGSVDDIKAAFEEGAALLPFLYTDLHGIKIVDRPVRPWSTLENKLETAVQDVFELESARFGEAVAESGPDALQDDALWAQFQENMNTALVETILAIVFLSIDHAQRDMPAAQAAAIPWDVVRAQARAYAESYSMARVTQLTQTTRKRLQKVLADWVAREGELEELVDGVDHVIDDRSRATNIAVTESTDAFSYGRTYAYVQAGYGPPGMRAPLHPHCRCDTKTYELPDGSKVLLWWTMEDEKVCKKPIQTMIGEINGCRDMHTRVISVGPYFGFKLADAIRKARQVV